MHYAVSLAIFFALFIAPILVGGEIAKRRNRNVNKGQFIGLVFLWVGVIGLWLGLKTRVVKDGIPYLA